MQLNESDPSVTVNGSERSALTSWKEIAAHLGVSVKTAQRYEAELGLPVKRLSGRVSISLLELREWQDSQTVQGKSDPVTWWNEPRTLRMALAICAVTVLAGVLGFAVSSFKRHSGTPTSAYTEGTIFTVLDAEGKPVWRYAFSTPEFEIGPFSTYFGDLDLDGETETLKVWQSVNRDLDGWSLHCFSESGKIRWTLDMQDTVRNAAGRDFRPPFVIRDYEVFASPRGDGTKWVATVFVNVTDVVSTLVIVDSKGQRQGQYWHLGHLNAVRAFDATGDGKLELVAGGVRHPDNRAVLVAFDPAEVAGASPTPEKDPGKLFVPAKSSEVATGLLARSAVSEELAVFNFISALTVIRGHLRAQVFETLQSPEGYLLYDFGPGLAVRDIVVSAAYGEMHHLLQRQKRLKALIPEVEVARLKAGYRLERWR